MFIRDDHLNELTSRAPQSQIKGHVIYVQVLYTMKCRVAPSRGVEECKL